MVCNLLQYTKTEKHFPVFAMARIEGQAHCPAGLLTKVLGIGLLWELILRCTGAGGHEACQVRQSFNICQHLCMPDLGTEFSTCWHLEIQGRESAMLAWTGMQHLPARAESRDRSFQVRLMHLTSHSKPRPVSNSSR